MEDVINIVEVRDFEDEDFEVIDLDAPNQIVNTSEGSVGHRRRRYGRSRAIEKALDHPFATIAILGFTGLAVALAGPAVINSLGSNGYSLEASFGDKSIKLTK